MTKHRNGVKTEEPQKTSATTERLLAVAIAVLAVLLGLSYFNQRSARDTASSLSARLDQIDSRLQKLSANVEQVASRRAAPAQSGPDPNRAYAVKVDGAPVEGPLTAAVTIAEFSDFQ